MFRCLKANYITIYEILYHQTEIAHLRHLINSSQISSHLEGKHHEFYVLRKGILNYLHSFCQV